MQYSVTHTAVATCYTHNKLLTLWVNMYHEQASSHAIARAHEGYSAITGVTGYSRREEPYLMDTASIQSSCYDRHLILV